MLNFTGKTPQGEIINFKFNEIRHIMKNADLVILERPRDVLVKFSTVEVKNYGKRNSDSYFRLAGLASRL